VAAEGPTDTAGGLRPTSEQLINVPLLFRRGGLLLNRRWSTGQRRCRITNRFASRHRLNDLEEEHLASFEAAVSSRAFSLLQQDARYRLVLQIHHVPTHFSD